MCLVKKIILSLIFTSSALLLFAKVATQLFIITKITNRVYIAHPGSAARINSTSTIIVGDHFLTIIESQTDAIMAARLIKEIRIKISRLPIKYLVFTHSHSDHISGASAFLLENPSLTIVASQKTAAHISLYASEEQKTWEEIIHQKSIEAKRKGDSPASEEKKKYYLNASSDLNTYYLDLKSSVIVPPNLTFSDSLTLYDSGMEIQLKYFGAGHTPGDIVVLVLPDKVLVTGDLVHDFEPLFPDADPDSWIRILEKIQQMDFNYFVGGHGDMHQGKIIISLWENYMEELKTKTLAAIAQGLTLQGFQNEIAIESFASLQNGYGERIQRFRTSYMKYLTGPLLDAVKDEIGSLWKFYGGN